MEIVWWWVPPPPSLAKRQTISGFFLMKASLIDRLKHGNGKANLKNMGRISVGPLLWVKSLPPPPPPPQFPVT